MIEEDDDAVDASVTDWEAVADGESDSERDFVFFDNEVVFVVLMMEMVRVSVRVWE